MRKQCSVMQSMAATQCWTVIDAGAEGLDYWQHVLPDYVADYVAGWRIYRGVVGPGLQFQLPSGCARNCNWLQLYVAVLYVA